MRILALDVGTSSVKSAVLDTETGKPLGTIARAAYPLDSPEPDTAEVSADRLWQAVAEAGRHAVRNLGDAGLAGRDVQGVGLAVLTPALVLLGKDDKPLLPVITHLDRRSRPAARQVQATLGEEFLREIGNRPLPGGISALTYRQLLVGTPYLTHKVGAYLHVNGWLGCHMTGEKFFDPGNACFTGLFGTLTDRKWSPRWCDYFDVDRAWLPSVVCGTSTIGALRSTVAAELGVPAGIPVKLGTADTSSAMLFAGMKEGDLMHVVGTTQVLAAITSRPEPSPSRLTRLLGVGDDYIQVTHNPVGGVALDWLHQLCFRDVKPEEFYGSLIREALERKTRVTLDPPYLGGDRLQIEANRAAFRDLELTTDRLDILSALLQAMVQRHREAFEIMKPFGPYRRFLLTGGAAEVVRKLIPEYQNVESLEEGSLKGIAKLFVAARS